jgi:hypothetical protein
MKYKETVFGKIEVKETKPYLVNVIDTLVVRLKKLNISLEISSNYPWLYLRKVNGKLVKELYQSEHGFVIGYSPIRIDSVYKLNDLSVIFKTIRKYL